MESLESLAQVDLKRRRIFQSRKCFLCHDQNEDGIVTTPSLVSISSLCEAVNKLSQWKYDDALHALKVLDGPCTPEHLKFMDAHWHITCYKKFTHKKTLASQEKRFIRLQEEHDCHRDSPMREDEDDDFASESVHLTRSSTPMYSKTKCFFCDLDGQLGNRLYHVSFDSAGASLRRAVELSGNEVYRVRLCESIAPGDAHAIDVLYHKACWARNVTNVIRRSGNTCTSGNKSQTSSFTASDLEFIDVIEDFLQDGNVTCMADLHTTYLNICSSNGVNIEIEKTHSRKQLKILIETNIAGVVFTPAKQRNDSERVSLEVTRDKAMWKLEEDSDETQLKLLMQAALTIRSICENSSKWQFEGSLDFKAHEVPEKLSLFFKWCLVGKAAVSKNVRRINEVSDRSKRLSQILMFECLSDRQATYAVDGHVRRTREFPLQVGLGLTLYKETRSRKLVDLVSRFGLSVNYDRIKQINESIAKAVVKRMEITNGIYVPPELKNGEFTHFAADNLDFQEDTPDGKRTLHGTVLIAYQSMTNDDAMGSIKFQENDNLCNIPESPYELLPCTLRANVKPLCRALPKFDDYLSPQTSLKAARISDIAWLLGRDMCLRHRDTHCKQNQWGLTWSSHNSLVSEVCQRKTVVAVFPILNKTPTDRSVQLTVIEQFKKVKALITGPGKKTIITVDLGLYRPMQQLQMALGTDAILLPGDLHIMMAQLRAIGSFIELSGIPELWLESGIYSDIVVKRILEGKPVRRSIEAHLVTLHVLFSLFSEEFFNNHADERLECDSLIKNLMDVSNNEDVEYVKQANDVLLLKLNELDIDQKMIVFSKDMSTSRPTFAMAIQYMDMVFSMLAFIRSVRSANWSLRLAALHDFTKYFFAMDLRNYASMTALHLAEMTALKTEDPDSLKFLENGLWAPNKSGKTFCCLGADECLEQENRKMKVMGGLVGITLQPRTLTKYFLTAPYAQKLSSEVRLASHSQSSDSGPHHQVGQHSSSRQFTNAASLMASFKEFTVPFQYEGHDLVNLVTKRVASKSVTADVCRMSTAGTEQYDEFVRSRLVDRSINVWDSMKNLKLQLFRSTAKKTRVQTAQGVVQVKQDSNLFTRSVLICRSRPDMDIKGILGKYELTVVPRSLFHPDGSMIHSDGKSKLMHHLEDIGTKHAETLNPPVSHDGIHSGTADLIGLNVAVVDGMAEVQILSNATLKSVADLTDSFCNVILKKYGMFSEIHMVFDTYLNDSLKTTERARRQKGMEPVRYRILGNDNIKLVPLKKLLSHTETKDEITVAFSEALIAAGRREKKNVTVSFRGEALSTFMNADRLRSTHEEADTKLILHAVDAAQRGATRIRIFSPDTDVLVLAIRRVPMLPENTAFVTMGTIKREIFLQPIFDSLGPKRAAALPGLHALSGADVTGSFSGKAKTSFWKKFIEAEDCTLIALSSLGVTDNISESTLLEIEKFVCAVYRPTVCTTPFDKLAELRWWFYSKKQIQGPAMPPTAAALHPAIRRSHFQCMEWERDCEPHPGLPSPCNYGWLLNDGKHEPILCDLPCAPDDVLNVIKCSCQKGRCAPPCKCAMQQPPLRCTEMCTCGGEEELCDNVYESSDIDSDESNSDDNSETEELV
jgi:hypothetical protein